MDWKMFFAILLGVPAVVLAVALLACVGAMLFGFVGGLVGAFIGVLALFAAVVGHIASDYK